MLTVRLVHGGADRWAYFAEDIELHQADDRQADYYLAGGSVRRWLGSGMPDRFTHGLAVDEHAFTALFEDATDPLTGEALGRAASRVVALEDRIARRVHDEISAEMSEDERARMTGLITREEESRTQQQPVTAFEMVFNPPKSVSAVWAVADAGTKAKIAAAHQAALDATMVVLERDYARTRVGTDGVAQVATKGVVAAGFDHVDTRAGDPQLHTHVMVANRVQGPDGKWRTLDSRNALMPGVVTLSATYDAALRDEMTARFGVRWTIQQVSAKPEAYHAWRRQKHRADSPASREQFALHELHLERKNLKWEIEGVPNELLARWSRRSVDVDERTDERVAAWTAAHGRAPSTAQILRWRAASALHTRTAKSKTPVDLATQSARWRTEARGIVGDGFRFAERILRPGRATPLGLRADDVPVDPSVIPHLVQQTLGELTAHTTWRRSNAIAAAHRVLAPHTFRSATDRDRVVTDVVDQVLAAAVPLTERAGRRTVDRFTTPDGGSAFEPASRDLYTTTQVWDAETHLLDAKVSERLACPASTTEPDATKPLAPDQRRAVDQLLTSGRQLDVLVGPAGAGKTTSLSTLRHEWESHGGSVIGLAPSAAAAKVLGSELEITTDNTAKWLTESTRVPTRGRFESAAAWTARCRAHRDAWTFRKGQLVIIDEAGMAGTLALSEILTQCEDAGAKLVLVGDQEQLSAVDAGGAFGMLVRALPDHAALESVWRFTAAWEKDASTGLREGRKSALAAYVDHDRIHRGTTDEVLDRAFAAWRDDTRSGKESLLLAADTTQVILLNDRAQAWHASEGHLGRGSVPIAHDLRAYVGDRIMTRLNDRRLLTGDGFVRNGSTFTVVRANRDGGLVVVDDATSTTTTLPAAYVAEHVDLAYAATVHRAQGRTVDTAHTIVTSSMNRGALYVAMTRGRSSNHAWVDVSPDDILEGAVNPGMRSWREILDRVLDTPPEAASAHETEADEADRLGGTMQLTNEYETLAGIENNTYADDLFARLSLTLADTPARRALVDQLGTLRAAGQDPETLLTNLLADLDPDVPGDLAAQLRRDLASHARKTHPSRIAGLTDSAPATNDTDLAHALADREQALALRAEAVLDRALTGNALWTRRLGTPVLGRETEWRRAALTLAAYRDKWQVRDDETILDAPAITSRQRRDQRIAERAEKTLKAAAGTEPTPKTRPTPAQPAAAHAPSTPSRSSDPQY